MLANPPQSRSANGLNQYLAINNNAITHDANGNLQSDGLWAYGHDLDNRLVSAVRNNPASDVSLGYDPAGRLSRTVVDSQITDLLYDGTDLIAEYAGAGNLTTRHIHGPGVDASLVSITGTTKTWRYADHLGSVIAEADAAGNAVAIRGYGPFGENGSTAPNRFGYTGQQYIAGLGLYYYKARWYSPTMGRFLETDPIGYGDGVNWYVYVGNNPVNRVDPNGLFASPWHMYIGYSAGRELGMGVWDSLKLGWADVDHDIGTQRSADAFMHSMTPPNWTVDAAIGRTNRWIADNLALGTYEGAGRAMGANGDSFAGGHEGHQTYNGLSSLITTPEGRNHVVDDWFPSMASVNAAITSDVAMLKGAGWTQNGPPNGSPAKK